VIDGVTGEPIAAAVIEVRLAVPDAGTEPHARRPSDDAVARNPGDGGRRRSYPTGRFYSP
jgi:hypothetical protein